MTKEMSVLSIDPGENVGIAQWWSTGQLINNFILPVEDFMHWLARSDGGYDAIVYEDFMLRQGKAVAQTGSKFLTSQVVGALKLWAILHDVPIYSQPSNILSVASLHALGEPLPAGHLPDDVSAYLHGYYWFEGKGVLKPISRV